MSKIDVFAEAWPFLTIILVIMIFVVPLCIIGIIDGYFERKTFKKEHGGMEYKEYYKKYLE